MSIILFIASVYMRMIQYRCFIWCFLRFPVKTNMAVFDVLELTDQPKMNTYSDQCITKTIQAEKYTRSDILYHVPKFGSGHPLWAACGLTPCKGASGQGGHVIDWDFCKPGLMSTGPARNCKNIKNERRIQEMGFGVWNMTLYVGDLGDFWVSDFKCLGWNWMLHPLRWSQSGVYNHRKEPTFVGTCASQMNP